MILLFYVDSLFDHLSSLTLPDALTALAQGIGFIITTINPYFAGFFVGAQAVLSHLANAPDHAGRMLVIIKRTPNNYAKLINYSQNQIKD